MQKTIKFGLVGKDISYSYSPMIHNLLGNVNYELFDIAEEDIDNFLKKKHFNGLNVTIPYKEKIYPLCQNHSPLCKKLGVLNTIKVEKDGSLTGHNTDFLGFIYLSLSLNLCIKGKNIVLLGSGGSSKMLSQLVKDLGANSVTTVSRTGSFNYKNLKTIKDSVHIIINTTPLGNNIYLHESPLYLKPFKNCEAVIDLNYNPIKSRLLMEAESLNLKTCNGLPMLVAQAFFSNKIFLNQEENRWLEENPTFSKTTINEIKKIYHKTLCKVSNLVLIGMPGSGKSLIGKLLSKELSINHIDSDILIEREYKESPKSIIENYGEAYFRKIEEKILLDLSREKGNIISLGGGSILNAKAMKELKRNSYFIYIDRPLLLLSTQNRPLSKNIDNLKKLYEDRYPIYSKLSDFKVENSGNPQNTIDNILKKWREV